MIAVSFGYVWVCVWVGGLRSSFTYFAQSSVRCPHKRIVTIINVCIARHNMPVQLIRFRKQISPLFRVFFSSRGMQCNIAHRTQFQTRQGILSFYWTRAIDRIQLVFAPLPGATFAIQLVHCIWSSNYHIKYMRINELSINMIQ